MTLAMTLDLIKRHGQPLATIAFPLAAMDALWQAGSVRSFDTQNENEEILQQTNFIQRYFLKQLSEIIDYEDELMLYLIGPAILAVGVAGLSMFTGSILKLTGGQYTYKTGFGLGLKMFGAVFGWNFAAYLASYYDDEQAGAILALATGLMAALCVIAVQKGIGSVEENNRQVYISLFTAVFISAFLWSYAPDAALSMMDESAEGGVDHTLAAAAMTFAFAMLSFGVLMPLVENAVPSEKSKLRDNSKVGRKDDYSQHLNKKKDRLFGVDVQTQQSQKMVFAEDSGFYFQYNYPPKDVFEEIDFIVSPNTRADEVSCKIYLNVLKNVIQNPFAKPIKKDMPDQKQDERQFLYNFIIPRVENYLFLLGQHHDDIEQFLKQTEADLSGTAQWLIVEHYRQEAGMDSSYTSAQIKKAMILVNDAIKKLQNLQKQLASSSSSSSNTAASRSLRFSAPALETASSSQSTSLPSPPVKGN